MQLPTRIPRFHSLKVIFGNTICNSGSTFSKIHMFHLPSTPKPIFVNKQYHEIGHEILNNFLGIKNKILYCIIVERREKRQRE